MGDSTVLPQHLGFVEIEGSAATPGPGRGQKRPPSPAIAGDGEDSPESTTAVVGPEGWLVSDSGSEEGEDDANCPFTVDKIPRPSCDYEEQINVLYKNPETKVRGPLPIRLFPAFKSGKHVFGVDYNLDDKSEIIVSSPEDCLNGCQCLPMCLLQFVDIKIAGYRHVESGCANIFGFIAARDTIEPLRNYVYRRGIDDCEAVFVKRKTGVARLSLTSPARVISMLPSALIEFELYARTKDSPEDEPRGDCLIEGCTELTNLRASKSFVEHRRLYGKRCALDVKYIVVMSSVEARVSIKVLRLGTIAGGVNMKLRARTSGFDDEVIRLFQGAAPEPGSVMSFAVAVERYSNFDLYIEAAPRDDGGQEEVPCSWWQCSFPSDSGFHWTDEAEVELGQLAKVSVKVTWKSYRETP